VGAENVGHENRGDLDKLAGHKVAFRLKINGHENTRHVSNG